MKRENVAVLRCSGNFGQLGTPGLGPPWAVHRAQQRQRQTVGLHGAACLSVDVRGKGGLLQQAFFFVRIVLVTGADARRACPWQRGAQPRVPVPHLCPPGLSLCPRPLFRTRASLGVCSGGCQILRGFGSSSLSGNPAKSYFSEHSGAG